MFNKTFGTKIPHGLSLFTFQILCRDTVTWFSGFSPLSFREYTQINGYLLWFSFFFSTDQTNLGTWMTKIVVRSRWKQGKLNIGVVYSFWLHTETSWRMHTTGPTTHFDGLLVASFTKKIGKHRWQFAKNKQKQNLKFAWKADSTLQMAILFTTKKNICSISTLKSLATKQSRRKGLE